MPATSSGSSEGTGRTKRSDSITSWDSVSHDAVSAALASPSEGTSTTVSSSSAASFQGSNGQETPSSQVYGRSWELEMETLLKVRQYHFW
jgi:PH and SEC7 domain-containing protein